MRVSITASLMEQMRDLTQGQPGRGSRIDSTIASGVPAEGATPSPLDGSAARDHNQGNQSPEPTAKSTYAIQAANDEEQTDDQALTYPSTSLGHTRKGSNTDPAEAIRRGLSFGPLGTKEEREPLGTGGIGKVTLEGILRSTDHSPVRSSIEGPKTTSKTFHLPTDPIRKRDKTPIGEKLIPPGERDLATLSDMELAQRLGIRIDQEEHPPNRTVRKIIRGNPAKATGKAGEKPRTYFLAANLTEESKYAIECALGTILRDGEILIVTFAIDKNSKTGRPQEGVNQADDSTTAEAIASEATSLSEQSARKPSRFESLRTLVPGSRKPSTSSEPRETKEQERQRAAEELVAHCEHFLRRTALQVFVLVEVIHCQNAQHMLLEAIDTLKPTLVIVGSRGLSQVHGNIYASFSRYLIKKSSVPVMTARLKPSSKVKHSGSESLMGNNLQPTENLVEVNTQDLEQRRSRWEAMQNAEREAFGAHSGREPLEDEGGLVTKD